MFIQEEEANSTYDTEDEDEGLVAAIQEPILLHGTQNESESFYTDEDVDIGKVGEMIMMKNGHQMMKKMLNTWKWMRILIVIIIQRM